MLELYTLNYKGSKMAEIIIQIKNELHRYEDGLESGLITKKEYTELTTVLTYELKLLTSQN